MHGYIFLNWPAWHQIYPINIELWSATTGRITCVQSTNNALAKYALLWARIRYFFSRLREKNSGFLNFFIPFDWIWPQIFYFFFEIRSNIWPQILTLFRFSVKFTVKFWPYYRFDFISFKSFRHWTDGLCVHEVVTHFKK